MVLVIPCRPVVRDVSPFASSGEEGSGGNSGSQSRKPRGRGSRYAISRTYNKSDVNRSPTLRSNMTTNATGVHLDINDARGYDWRAKPKGLGEAGGYGTAAAEGTSKKKVKVKTKQKGKASESSGSSSDTDEDDDEGGARGYTQLRLEDDPEAEEISAATDYLFTGGSSQTALEEGDVPTATPHSQLNTTKNLLSEGQKIAYVGLVSLVAKNIIRQLQRVPGKELQPAISSTEEWRLRVMARLFQHMDIESGEQRMIESLAQHGVLPTDLSPSLITTQTVDNPDFDPAVQREREEHEMEKGEEREGHERETETEKQEEEALGPLEGEEKDASAEVGSDGESNGNKMGMEQAETERAMPEEREGAEDGDLGGPFDDTLPATEPPIKDTSVAASPFDDNGDISAAPTSPTASPEDTKPIIADPNTAARMELDENSKVTPMGLTRAPQTIDTLPSALEGVTTELSSADKTITLDLRWTVLCDLFLVLTADSVYDARSRVLLEWVAGELGLHWMDVTKFEKRVTDALEIEEGVGGSLKGKRAVRKRAEGVRRRRLVMMGLATVGGGLVIGLSAGLMAPLIGAGLGAALGTIGIGGTTGFLGGVGGAAIITTTGTVGGAALGGTGMNRRTRTVRTFEFKPIHNNKRVNCIVSVGGFMNGPQDDPRLPFSVIDSIMGDVFSVLWEPDMMQEMGNAIYLLWNETLVQGVQQVLAATIAGGLVGALAWPLWLTKLGYFIDNPWSNALDRSHSCGLILADVLIKRTLGVRPITLVGFSLGARVIFYALVELARQKKFGIVQNVYLMGAPVTASDKTWKEARGVVAGRFVNAFSRTDWILGWLFRATTGGIRSIAGLHPVERVPEVENVDVTQTVPGHLQYRAFMPLVLDELGFRTTADYFDEPEDLNAIPEREMRYDEQVTAEQESKSGPRGFTDFWSRRKNQEQKDESKTETAKAIHDDGDDDDLPPREEEHPAPTTQESAHSLEVPPEPFAQEMDETERVLAELRENGIEVRELQSSLPPLPIQARTEALVADAASIELPSKAHSKTPQPLQPLSTTSSSSSRRGSEPNGETSTDAAGASNVADAPPLPAYPRKFSSTLFDADGLPPSAPAASADHGEVSLSFAESYEDEDLERFEQPNAGQDGGLEQVRPGEEDTTLQSAQSYGLSDGTARELARQFQSSGMSTQGASAAAKLAQTFSEAGQGTANRRNSLEVDPWNTLAAPPQTLSMGREKSNEDDVLASTPKPLGSGVSGWGDNPWG